MRGGKLLLLLPPFLVLSSGCLPYYPAIAGSHVPGTISIPGRNGASAGRYAVFDGGNVATGNNDERNTLFRSHFLSIRSNKYVTTSRGLFAYGGSYSTRENGSSDENHSYFGPGFELSGVAHHPIGPVDIGVGINLTGAMELGNFTTFRKGQEDYTGMFPIMLAFYPLVRYHATDQTSVAFQCSVGFPGVISPSLTVQHDDYVFWSCVLPKYLDEPELSNSRFTVGFGRLLK